MSWLARAQPTHLIYPCAFVIQKDYVNISLCSCVVWTTLYLFLKFWFKSILELSVKWIRGLGVSWVISFLWFLSLISLLVVIISICFHLDRAGSPFPVPMHVISCTLVQSFILQKTLHFFPWLSFHLFSQANGLLISVIVFSIKSIFLKELRTIEWIYHRHVILAFYALWPRNINTLSGLPMLGDTCKITLTTTLVTSVVFIPWNLLPLQDLIN